MLLAHALGKESCLGPVDDFINGRRICKVLVSGTAASKNVHLNVTRFARMGGRETFLPSRLIKFLGDLKMRGYPKVDGLHLFSND